MNAAAGSGERGAELQSRIETLFRQGRREVSVTAATPGRELLATVDRAIAAGANVIVAAGGDGTVSAVAARVAGSAATLGVIPLGTLNHFAKDLSIPLDVEDAVAVILGGRINAVDVGEVNGRVFINNSSLGLYPHFVQLRKQHPIRGPGKWVVAAWAALNGLAWPTDITVRIEIDGVTRTRRTPVLFIGNNQYRVAGFDGSRDSLAGGKLAVYIVKAHRRRHLLSLAWKLFTGRTSDLHELELLLGSRTTIDVKGSPVPVAVDGEVTALEAPLEYRTRPGALRVFVPKSDPREE